MNVPRLLSSAIAGLSTTLIAYSAFYVRGDTAAVFAYLGARGAVKRMAGHASAADIEAARSKLLALGEQIADPQLALQTLPLSLLLGAVVFYLIWRVFSRGEGRSQGVDVQERMVLKLAYRQGGRFLLSDLSRHSPLNTEQAEQVTRRMLERGQLERDGEHFVLSSRILA